MVLPPFFHFLFFVLFFFIGAFATNTMVHREPGLPKAIAKRYGITAEAWVVYKRSAKYRGVTKKRKTTRKGRKKRRRS